MTISFIFQERSKVFTVFRRKNGGQNRCLMNSMFIIVDEIYHTEKLFHKLILPKQITEIVFCNNSKCKKAPHFSVVLNCINNVKSPFFASSSCCVGLTFHKILLASTRSLCSSRILKCIGCFFELRCFPFLKFIFDFCNRMWYNVFSISSSITARQRIYLSEGKTI